ncbi:serine/threonine dehydratase [Humitalea sp. 24SJ18S-53]|uniref:serine/threonine dehydratase n=1 Tax=Humitalea sp. 24SJ18S-53 TaxID=3422307 RepID=UPI003D66A5FD
MPGPLPDPDLNRDLIRAAASRIAPHVRRTPVLRVAGAALGLAGDIVLKLELVQATGSFKPRGAFNRMLSVPVPASGVIAASGGNHGAAVAYAARVLGHRAEIFVPAISAAAKRARIAAEGAVLTVGGETYDAARLASMARADETGALVVHAYDQPEVLAGQGTVALEWAEQSPDLTHALVAVGGGGLLGGMAAWWGRGVGLVAVEPEACPKFSAALAAGRPVPAPVSGLAADSLGASQVGQLMFGIAAPVIAANVLVPDAAIREAQRRLWDAVRIVAEPGGAAALAALICGAWVPPPGAVVGVLVCGGNCDPGSVVSG